ncbi:pyrophosphatase PpaX [Crassaminicella thermophila]|uniref:Pyrophosphatase PpaX n=1 Tax=Crassaminicella thermophila TaxID=2599308 RepID=A0A5C0SD11_CRATE|nr:pyrophosphatase PpaX [Crassaminicella thermophila]QEK11338.1 pyrophosphatase PpaX [Crassaminicella thermophila]
MSIKAILFDLDGTLLDTNELIIQSFQHTYKTHLNKEVPREKIVQSFGEILKVTLDRECPGCSEEAIKTYRAFQALNFEKLITVHTGVKEALEILHKKGYKLGVVTSRLNESARKGLKLFDLEHYFESIIGANDTKKHKPDPTPALMALKELDIEVDEAIMVGDSPFDVLCGKNAGIISVAVAWSALPREIYMQHNPDYVVDSMEELIDIIENLNKNQSL